MKIDIRDMFENYIDEDGTEMKNIADNLDIERIRSLTMNKINAGNNVKARGFKAMKKSARIALLAAIISVLLVGSVSAAVIISRVRIDTDLGEKTYAFSDGDEYTYNANGQFTIEGREDAKNEIMGFRLGYFPEFDMSSPDVCSTIVPLRDTLGFYIEASRIIDEKNYASINDLQWSEDEQEDDFGRIDSYTNSSKLDEDLEEKGLSPEYLKDAYNHFIIGESGRAYAVDIYSYAKNDQQYVTENNIEFVKNGELCGMETTYYIMHDENRDEAFRSIYCLLLCSEEHGACITVVGTGGFEELEKIAEGLEVVHSGVEDTTDDGTFHGLFSDLMFG